MHSRSTQPPSAETGGAVEGARKDEIQPSRSRLARGLWLAMGLTCVGIGALGVVLPGLPTTPFLVLAAACFLRSSRRLYERLLKNPTFGPSVRAWRETGTLPAATKWTALGTMAFFVTIALLWGIPREWTAVRWTVLGAAVVGAWYLLSIPSERTPDA